MKLLQLFAYSLIVTTLIIGCTNSSEKMSATDIMKDPEKQKEIFSIIVNDSAQMRQFKEYKKHYKNDMYVIQNCGYMINGDTTMCKMMMEEMMNMMEKDSAMCDVLCRHMQKHKCMKDMMEKNNKTINKDCNNVSSGHQKNKK